MIDPRPEDLKTRQLCVDFIKMFSGERIDAVEAKLRMQSRWGIRLDWHEFSDALDEMNTRGEVEVFAFSRSGMALYRVK